MKTFVRMSLVVLTAWGLGSSAALAEEAPPNVVLIVADDLGYGDLGCYGGTEIPTPQIDALSSQGVRCTSGYVSGPYCSPTRAGLLTGRYQQRFGHEFNPGGRGMADATFGLSVDQTTIADFLRSAGYETAMVGKWHLGNAPQFHPQQRGFDEFFGFLGGAHPYFPRERAAPILRGTQEVEEPTYLTDAFTREALAVLDRPHEKPFFLYLAYNAVHTPLEATPEALARVSSIEDERRRKYAAMLTSLDDGVGAVLARLKERNLEDRTLVMFLSDNGGPVTNGSTNTPLNGQKATTWEGGVRVPFVLRWPGRLPAGAVYSHPVIQLDLLPTVLAAAGAPVPEERGLDGVDLLPFLSGERDAPPHQQLYWRFGEQMAIRQGDWKLMKARGDHQPRLFHLAEDLGEMSDLAAAQPERVAELQSAWDEWASTLEEPRWKQPQRRRSRTATP